MISILSCFNPMYLRQLLWPQDLSTAFRICKNNIAHVDVKTFLAKDFGRIYQLTPGLPCVLKNAMEHWSAMKLWTLSSFSAESWHVVLVTFDVSWPKKVGAPCEAYQRYPFNTLSVWIWNLLSQIQLYSAICKQIQVFTENRRNPKLATPQPYLSCGAAAIKVILGSLGQPMQP